MEKTQKSPFPTLEQVKSTKGNQSSINELDKAEKINKEIDSNLKNKFEQTEELQNNINEKVEESLKNFQEHTKEVSDHLANMTDVFANLSTAHVKNLYNMNTHDTLAYYQKLPKALYESYTTFWNTYNNEVLGIIQESTKSPKNLPSYNQILFTAIFHAPIKSYTHCLERFHENIYSE